MSIKTEVKHVVFSGNVGEIVDFEQLLLKTGFSKSDAVTIRVRKQRKKKNKNKGKQKE